LSSKSNKRAINSRNKLQSKTKDKEQKQNNPFNKSNEERSAAKPAVPCGCGMAEGE
jgi:hypothetical protein